MKNLTVSLLICSKCLVITTEKHIFNLDLSSSYLELQKCFQCHSCSGHMLAGMNLFVDPGCKFLDLTVLKLWHFLWMVSSLSILFCMPALSSAPLTILSVSSASFITVSKMLKNWEVNIREKTIPTQKLVFILYPVAVEERLFCKEFKQNQRFDRDLVME